MMRALVLGLWVGCAAAPDGPAAGPDLQFDRDRLDGTLARIADLARAGRTSRELHDRYHVQYALVLRGSQLTVTVWAEPVRESTPSQVAAAVERAGGEVLEGTEGVVRARLLLDQIGALSRDPVVRMIRIVRHEEPLP